jgi:predicted ArsR family transcriptional regulator
MTVATSVLEEHGFEPARSTEAVRLRNCPFHPVVDAAPKLVCGLNREFLAGLLDGLGADGCIEAVLAPRPGACCVELRPR